MVRPLSALVLLAATALPAVAQFRVIDISFEGMGCASCIESLPSRMKRMRGVESAEVDAAAGRLLLRLAESNRVHIEQVRDAIAQDGSKAKSARVEIRATPVHTDGRFTLTAPGWRTPYPIDAGAHTKLLARLAGTQTPADFAGEIADLRAATGPPVIRVTSVRTP